MQQVEAAEEMLRRFVARSKTPESGLVLAQYLGRHGKLDKALDICEEAVPVCRSEQIAATCMAVLYAAKPDKKQLSRVEKLLETAIQKERTVLLLDSLGAFHNLQENFAKAEEAFRDALKLDANDLTALNNLSWLLAFQPGKEKNAEALLLVQRAIKTMGPFAGLLDTRGVIHLRAGRAEQAVKDLEDSVAESPTASHYFHLAQAYDKAKDLGRAKTTLTEAHRIGLQESVLHPLERSAYQQLCVQLRTTKK
jgi:cellulose synthase operon protein C